MSSGSQPAISQIARRDRLIEELIEILRPQLATAPLNVEQHREMQAAIANYSEDLLRGEK